MNDRTQETPEQRRERIRRAMERYNSGQMLRDILKEGEKRGGQ